MSIRQSINNLLGGGQGGTVLGPGYTDKMNYIDKFIANEKYDIEKGGKQYEDDPEGLVWDAYRNRLVREGAPTGLKGNILGMIDWMNANPLAARLFTGGKLPIGSRPTDLDQAGGYADPYGKGPDPGTLGGQRVEIKPKVKNPYYDAAKARTFQLQQTGAVPAIDQTGRWINQFATDAYTGWRDPRRMAGNLGMVGSALKDATYYGHQLDKAQMYDFMNSPLGQARASLTAQQAMAVPRLTKAALIEAIAKRQGAANEFGQLGTQRTYFTG
jgi:hypothetical protein